MFYSDNPISLQLSAEESQHCSKVLRHKLHDAIELFDGKGNHFDCRITNVSKTVGYKIIATRYFEKSLVNYEIAVAPPKNAQRFEFMIEKLIELGVQKIYLLKTANTERHHINRNRLDKHILAACKQSKTYHLPQIEMDIDFKTLLTNDFEHCMFYCGNELPKTSIVDIATKDKNIRFYIGPEGDFSPTEAAYMQSKKGTIASLGTQRLRTETAAMHVASVMSFKS